MKELNPKLQQAAANLIDRENTSVQSLVASLSEFLLLRVKRRIGESGSEHDAQNCVTFTPEEDDSLSEGKITPDGTHIVSSAFLRQEEQSRMEDVFWH